MRLCNLTIAALPIHGKITGNSIVLPFSMSKSRKRRSSAEDMALSIFWGPKEISVSEFFAKNRHLLGFDNPRKALLTTVKEAVDNSLDACEEARPMKPA